MRLFRSLPIFHVGRLVCCVWGGLLVVEVSLAASVIPSSDALAVHEWGTFTSVAGPGGDAVYWQVLSGPPDLPCFVNRLSGRSLKGASTTIRMETPVLYFYAHRPMSVSVRVEFPQGLITEWYPRASRVQHSSFSPNSGSAIEWASFDVLPEAPFEFPVENRPSHYYAARETDASPLRMGEQQEKLIFYRGIGSFSVPLRVNLSGEGKLALRNTGPDPIPAVIVFENRGGQINYRRLGALDHEITVELPARNGQIDPLRREIEEVLIAQGLYPKEARAMVETWRDSWFEEGTRVFYVVPNAIVESVLPLTVDPAPESLVRVFVGRVEILSSWREKEIEVALAADDIRSLEKHGRFLQPFLQQVRRRTDRELPVSPRLNEFLAAAYSRIQAELESPACGK